MAQTAARTDRLTIDSSSSTSSCGRSRCGSEACSDSFGEWIPCRVWAHAGKGHTEPPVALIVDAILRAVQSGPGGPPEPDAARYTCPRADCCSPVEQRSCCDPDDKADCCGAADRRVLRMPLSRATPNHGGQSNAIAARMTPGPAATTTIEPSLDAEAPEGS